MALAPYGKKSKRKREQAAKREAREAIIDRAIGAAQLAVSGSGLCLPMCVLLQRILEMVLPPPRFSLRLGSLHVRPIDESIDPISFDPRTPEGIDIDAGFHSWLEDSNGRLLEPSAFLTLHSHGYAVDPDDYCLSDGPTFVHDGLRFRYEELSELELTGLAESEPHIAELMAYAMDGVPPTPGHVYLDVVWRVK